MLRNNFGMGLVELIVAAGLATVVSLAIATLYENMSYGQKRVALTDSLLGKKLYFQKMIEDDTALSNTIAAAVNVNMQCLRDKVVCNSVHVATAFSSSLDQITLYNNAPNPGAAVHDGRITSNRGFTEKGAECVGFSATGPGNDSCPVGYIINWYLSHAGQVGGISITLTAKMIFNPTTNNKFKQLINSNLTTPLGPYDASFTKTVVTLIDMNVSSCTQGGDYSLSRWQLSLFFS